MPSKGGLIGIILTGLAVIALGVAVWLTYLAATATEVQQAVQSPDTDPSIPPDLVAVPTGTNLGTFGLGLLCAALLLLVLYLAYQTRRFFALRYSLDRNAITVGLGDRKQVIPLANIRHVVAAQTVISQMRSKVYGTAENGSPTETTVTGPTAKAYPRQTTAQVEPNTEGVANVTEAEISEIPTQVEEPLEDFEPDDGPSYQLTQTAAADSSLDYLEPIEIELASFKEVDGVEEVEEADYTPVVEGANRQIEPVSFRSLAIDFDEKPSQDNGTQAGADGGEPSQETPFSEGGSVNFGVKAPLLSSWPGFYLNRANVSSLGPVQFYSTQPLAGTLLVRTVTQTYAISPREPQQFLREFQLRRRLGAIETVEEKVIPGQFLSHPLWHDRLGRGLILAGVILNLLLYVYLIVRFNDLAANLRMHFDKFGQVDRIGQRDELLLLPFIGLLGVIGNSVLGAFIHLTDRIPAYLLYGAAILLQVLTAVAVFVILLVSGS